MTAPRPQNVSLEVAIASLQGAIYSESGGANRIELNSALPLGGLTPSLGLVKAVIERVRLPVIAMVRPRPGGFCYGEEDWRVMQKDADLLLEAGAAGLAFGYLKTEGEVDIPRTRMMLRQMEGRAAVFHRAFDLTPDPFEALEMLIDLGVTRILTSGQASTAAEGAEVIRRLIKQAAGRIEILPGGSIRAHSVADLIKATGCDQVHAALRVSRSDPSTVTRPHLRFGLNTGLPEGEFEEVDEESVRAMRATLDGAANTQ
ncbi:MAG: copper homeostasis protein CutC [Phycisphaeraceae bacterium]